MPLSTNTVMDQLGVALRTISGLRVYDYPAGSIQPPAAVVGCPEEIEYDSTARRGADEADFEVHVLVSDVLDRPSRMKLAEYLSPGTRSIKAAIEAAEVGDDCRVSKAVISLMVVGAQQYLAATFTVHVIA